MQNFELIMFDKTIFNKSKWNWEHLQVYNVYYIRYNRYAVIE